MKFECDTKPLNAALAQLGRVIGEKSPIPVLRNVKVATQDDRILLTGTDMDTTIEAIVPAQVGEAGAACLPFHTLQKFAKSAKGTAVAVAMTDHSAVVKCGRGRIALHVMDAADFPNLVPSEGDPASVDGKTLMDALKFCLSAVEDSEVAFHIAGVNLAPSLAETAVWGTNGKACHRSVVDAIVPGGGGTIPVAGVATILGIMAAADTVEIAVSDRGWHIVTPGLRAWGKVIAAQYPDMVRVLGQFKSWADVAEIEAEDFSGALGIASCGADIDSQKSRNVVLRAEAGGNITMRGFKPTGDVTHSGRAEMDATATGPLAIVLNSRMLAPVAALGRFALKSAEGGTAVRMSAGQHEAVIMAIRASEAEMADV